MSAETLFTFHIANISTTLLIKKIKQTALQTSRQAVEMSIEESEETAMEFISLTLKI